MDEEALSPVVGTILLVAVTIVMAGVTFLLIQEESSAGEQVPHVAFQQDPRGAGGILTVAAVDGPEGVAQWSQVAIAPSSTAVCTLPTGPLDAGDVVTCSSHGTLVLAYTLPSGDTVLLFDGLVR